MLSRRLALSNVAKETGNLEFAISIQVSVISVIPFNQSTNLTFLLSFQYHFFHFHSKFISYKEVEKIKD